MSDTDPEFLPAHRIRTIEVDDRRITAKLRDGRTLIVPLSFYPGLRDASAADRAHCHVFGDGFSVEWPTLDYHVGAEGLMHGRKEGSWYPAWRKKHPIPSDVSCDFCAPKRRARVASRKTSSTRRKSKRA